MSQKNYKPDDQLIDCPSLDYHMIVEFYTDPPNYERKARVLHHPEPDGEMMLFETRANARSCIDQDMKDKHCGIYKIHN